MKKILLTVALLSVTSVAMAVDPVIGLPSNTVLTAFGGGYSAMNYQSIGQSSGTEAQSTGGFCSTTGSSCAGNTSGILGETLAPTTPMETGSGAGINGITGNMVVITPGGAATPNAGTYTSMSAITNGGYTNIAMNDPTVSGTVNSTTFAMQKPGEGIAGSGSYSRTSAFVVHGQAESFASIRNSAQAVTPNQ